MLLRTCRVLAHAHGLEAELIARSLTHLYALSVAVSFLQNPVFPDTRVCGP